MARRLLHRRRGGMGSRSTSLAEDFVALMALNDSGIRAAAQGTDDMIEALCENKLITLPDDVWTALWARRSRLSIAQRLVARPLTPAQLDLVITDENRVSVLAEALEHTIPTPAQVAAITAKPCASAVARVVDKASTWGLSADDWATWCLVAGGEVGLRWLIEHPDVDPSTYLASSAWVGRVTRGVRILVAQLLAVRPDAIDALCGADVDVTLVAEAAASHLLGGRDDLARAIAERDPADAAYQKEADAAMLWHAWLALIDNPFVSAEVIDELHMYYDANATNPAWYEFVNHYGYWRRRWQCAGKAFIPAVAAAQRTRAYIGYDPAVGLSGIDVAVRGGVVDTLNPRWRSSSFEFCTLALVADALAAQAPPVDYRGGMELGEIVVEKPYMDVLGFERIRDILRTVGSRRRVRRRGGGPARARYYPRTGQELAPGYPLQGWQMYRLDAAGAAVLGDSLHDETAWQALFSLLGDADQDEDVLALIEAARHLG